MAAPSLISRLASVFDTQTSPKTAGAFTCLAGDLLVVKAANEGAGATFGTPTGGTGTTYTSQQSIGVANTEARVQIWTCVVPTSQTITVSVAESGSADYGVEVEQWRGHGGVGVSNGTFVGSAGAPSTTLTGVGATSAISMIIADFVAGATTGKTYRTTDAGTFTESASAQVAGAYSYYLGYYANAGTSATKVVGMTAPSQQYSIAAVEILAVAGGATPVPLAPSTGTASAALAIRAPTRVLLAASSGAGTGSLVLQAGAPRLPLVPSTVTASGNLSIVAAIPTYTPPADVPKPAVLTTAARGISTYKFELAWSADLSRIGELTQARNRSLQLALNRAGAFSCQLPLDHELTDAVAEVETCVIISRDGEVIWSGPIWTVQETVSATAASLQIGAVGWLQTLDKRVVRASWNSGQSVSYSNQDAGLIALDLLTRSNADAVGAGAPTYIFPGAYELTQLRTRSYQPWSGILTAIVELTEIESGFDMVVDPATRELNISQRVGADQGVIFELPGDVSQVTRATDSGRILNYITAYSAAGSRAEADAESISQLGLFEEAQSLSDVINTNILVAFAAGEILVKSRPLRIVTFQPLAESAERPLSPRVFRDFNIGDTVRLTVRHGRLRLNRQFLRIFSFTVGFPDTGGTAVSDIQTTMGA